MFSQFNFSYFKNYHWPLRYIALTLVISVGFLLTTERAEAACTVPNQITNGQPADATVVMDNFNALNDCVNSALTPSGNPSGGNIAVFSGPKTVTNGDLTGDCMTAGGLAVICTRSNGAQLSYFATGTDADQLTGTVSVDRFDDGINADTTRFLRGDGKWATPPGGGSGSGANWWSGQVPTAANFPTLIKSGAAQIPTLVDDPDVGLLMSANLVSGENTSFALQDAPSSTGDWTVTARISPNLWPSNYNGIGLVLYESLSTKSVISGFWFNGGPLFRVRQQSNGSFISNTYSAQHLTTNQPFWTRVRYNHAGSAYFFEVSIDGKLWSTATSVAKTTLFNIAPDKVGLGFYINNSTTSKSALASCDFYFVEF